MTYNRRQHIAGTSFSPISSTSASSSGASCWCARSCACGSWWREVADERNTYGISSSRSCISDENHDRQQGSRYTEGRRILSDSRIYHRISVSLSGSRIWICYYPKIIGYQNRISDIWSLLFKLGMVIQQLF